jgi:DNA-binding NtrC family response regulator
MIDVRIICTYDAAKLAETLTRLLEAEEHRVRLTIGRQAMTELDSALETRDAVLLIWSPDARSQTYMLEWARRIEEARVIDITLTPDWPRLGRKSTVAIDFTQWRGERSERAAWNALNAA